MSDTNVRRVLIRALQICTEAGPGALPPTKTKEVKDLLHGALIREEDEANRRMDAETTVRSLSAMLGWANSPPRESLEMSLRAERAKYKNQIEKMEVAAGELKLIEDLLKTSQWHVEMDDPLSPSFEIQVLMESLKDAEAEVAGLRKLQKENRLGVSLEYVKRLIETVKSVAHNDECDVARGHPHYACNCEMKPVIKLVQEIEELDG